jgi:mono/diheme cytochrome c family protein
MKARAVRGSIVGVIVLLTAGAAGFYYYESKPETSPISRGEQLAHVAGCYACHGTSIDDPRVNFRLRDSAWQATDIAPIWEEEHSAQSIMTWVTHGVPESRRASHQNLLMQMPAYGDDGHLTEAEIEDVTAWALAAGLRGFQGYDNFVEDMPTLTAEQVDALDEEEIVLWGDRLSRQAGCYQCHGELGQGRIGNPASFKGYIPGFQGDDFLKLTANGDPAEIRHWINYGRGQAIESGLLGGLAQGYFDRQAIPMPGYRDLLDDSEIEVLVNYVQWLHRQGPMTAVDVENFATLIEDNL